MMQTFFRINSIKRLSILALFLFFYLMMNGQPQTIIKGVVTDAINNDPLPFANVFLIGSTIGTNADSIGKYSILADQNTTDICVSYLGYKSDTIKVQQGKAQVINFRLNPTSTQLHEMVFTVKKGDYKNKENPAVELIRNVIANKPRNITESFDYYECEKYKKIIFGVSNISEKIKNGKFLRKVKFVFNNVDTVKIPGKEILPIFINEQLIDYYFRKAPAAKKEIAKANKRISYAGFVDNEGVQQYLNYIYKDVNIYDDNISLFSDQFVSPISPLAPTMYRFYIMDTMLVDGDSCIKLSFFPRNKGDFLFQGYLYITKDSLFAVKKIDMTVNKDINLNWVKSLRVIQTYQRKDNKGWALTEDFIGADFGIAKDGLGLYGEKAMSYKNILFNNIRPNDFYDGDGYEEADDANKKTEEYWKEKRHHQLTNTENGIYAMMDSVSKVKAYRRAMAILELCVSGYPNFGLFEIGPVNTFYGFNPVEGSKVKFGGRTSPDLSRKLSLDTYIAYGFQDKKIKYNGELSYSLNKRTVYEFPVHSIKIGHQFDTNIPGQELKSRLQEDILLDFKRGVNDKWLYHTSYTFDYLKEFKNHFSYSIGFKNLLMTPAGSLHFYPANDINPMTNEISKIQTSTVCVNLRYAPNETFYQGKVFRVTIPSLNPIFDIRYTAAFKGIANGEYNYHCIRFSVSKRFLFAPLGYSDVFLEFGKLFGQVPYPLLLLHRANQTYSYQASSYNLMNFLEFVSDQYASIDIDHFFNGFLLNRVPLIKKFKLREAISFKALIGSLSPQNNPSMNQNLFLFPVTNNGEAITHSLSKMPYMEAGIGIGNIFKFFRIDVLKRLNYLHYPNVAEYGIRLEMKLDF